MPHSKFEISETLGKLNDLSSGGYALGFHIEFTTPKFVFQTYPKEWLDHYSSNGLLMQDPMVAWAFQNTGSLRWSDLDDPAGFMDVAAKYGMKYGVVIAVTSDGSRSLGGFSHTDREFTDAEIAELEAGVLAIHNDTADTAQLAAQTVDHLKKMSIMVTHPGS